MFTTPMGTPVDPDNFRHHLAKVSQVAGLGNWTTHELWSSAGSLVFAMGVPMKVISETLGHSSERVTSEVYVHLQAEHRLEAAEAMARALWS
jgi:integrase